jgi:hypothetical protein
MAGFPTHEPNEPLYENTYEISRRGGDQDLDAKLQSIARFVGYKPDLYWVNDAIAP